MRSTGGVGGRRPGVRVKTRTLIVIHALAFVFGVAISMFGISAQLPAPGSRPRGFDHAGYLKTWTDIYESVNKENALIDELNADVRAHPPGRVRSARRIEIWDQLIAEHEKQLKDFRKLRKAETGP